MPAPPQLDERLSSPRHHFAVAFAAYGALAIAYTWPLIFHLSSHLPGDLGDPLVVTSILWWNAHTTPLTPQWWDGFGFFPASGMMAFSEHFLGASLVASPLQWLGVPAIGAYNITLLLSYPLCGLAAYALVWRLTRRHDAAALGGLAYAFNPYRVAHLEHLELLMAFGMPAALLSLHAYAERRRPVWLIAFAAALVMQALSASYYAVFFTVFLGMWLVWFLRLRDWRATAAIVVAAAAAALVLSPVIAGYLRIHRSYDAARQFVEVLTYSADLTSLLTASPLSAAWGWTSDLNGGERRLFPGLCVVLVIAAGFVWHVRRTGAPPRRVARMAIVCWLLAAGFAGAALWAQWVGPWQWQVGWIRISMHQFYKPLSAAVLFAGAGMVLTETFQRGWRQRSPFAFYVVAAVVLFVCSLGPRPTFLGEQVLYEPPYAWLMRLPLFGDTIRVPARFGMLAMLALSVAAALAFNRLAIPRWRMAAFLAVAAGILGDSAIQALPLRPVPQQVFQIPHSDRLAPVLEVPLGDVWDDSAALYRATLHRARTVNGYNGFEPSYYQVLRRALDDRDPTILAALSSRGPLVIAADKWEDPTHSWPRFLERQTGIRRIADGDRWTLFRLPPQRQTPSRPRCDGEPVRIAAAADRFGPIDPGWLTDGDPRTRWITPAPQRAGDAVMLDLGRVESICGIELSMGREAVLYPGALLVTASRDGTEWTAALRRRLGGPAFQAALDNPSNVRLTLPMPATPLRYLRLEIEQSQREYPWAIADAAVIEAGGEELDSALVPRF